MPGPINSRPSLPRVEITLRMPAMTASVGLLAHAV
jgi:hypothetical protein